MSKSYEKSYDCKNCETTVVSNIATSKLGDCPICGCDTLKEVKEV